MQTQIENKKMELKTFVSYMEELINTNYVFAETKMINVLKSIASSPTLMAIFKSCLDGYNYARAKEKYLIENSIDGENRGRFILPETSQEILAFTFNLLMEFDSKRLHMGKFLNKYFYQSGSLYESYTSFSGIVLKPFEKAVKLFMESVISGSTVDPTVTAEPQIKTEVIHQEVAKPETPLQPTNIYSPDSYTGRCIGVLAKDKRAVKESPYKEAVQNEMLFVINTFINAVKLQDEQAIKYAYITYKYAGKIYKKAKLGLCEITKILQEENLV